MTCFAVLRCQERTAMPQKKQLLIEELAQHFHKPIVEVAELMGVCTTVLKKICRRYGIQRWPQRKLQSINKIINTLHLSMLTASPHEQQRIAVEINSMQKRKAMLISPLALRGDTLTEDYYKASSNFNPHGSKLQTQMTGAHGAPLSYSNGISGCGNGYGGQSTHDCDAGLAEVQLAASAARDASRQLEEAGSLPVGRGRKECCSDEDERRVAEADEELDEADDDSKSDSDNDPAMLLLAMRSGTFGERAAKTAPTADAVPAVAKAEPDTRNPSPSTAGTCSPPASAFSIPDQVVSKKRPSFDVDDQYVSPAFQRQRYSYLPPATAMEAPQQGNSNYHGQMLRPYATTPAHGYSPACAQNVMQMGPSMFGIGSQSCYRPNCCYPMNYTEESRQMAYSSARHQEMPSGSFLQRAAHERPMQQQQQQQQQRRQRKLGLENALPAQPQTLQVNPAQMPPRLALTLAVQQAGVARTAQPQPAKVMQAHGLSSAQLHGLRAPSQTAERSIGLSAVPAPLSASKLSSGAGAATARGAREAHAHAARAAEQRALARLSRAPPQVPNEVGECETARKRRRALLDANDENCAAAVAVKQLLTPPEDAETAVHDGKSDAIELLLRHSQAHAERAMRLDSQAHDAATAAVERGGSHLRRQLQRLRACTTPQELEAVSEEYRAHCGGGTRAAASTPTAVAAPTSAIGE
uniref:RWP-RK domain-containing protein n=1 Tax=Chrysotila carterae TaxID=13221 RepID=A0A7S4BII7_CHRCT